MLRTIIVATALLHVLAVHSVALDVVPPKKFDLKAIDAYVSASVKAKGLVGVSLALMRDGKIVWAKGYGKRSLEKDLPVEPETSFSVGSITKQFTCACILLLAEEGKLSVTDPIGKYFPNLTKADSITLLDLMNHTSGYPDYYPLDFVDRRMRKPISFEDMCKDYASGKLDFDPGTRYSYSNTGYILLGGVVEKVTGEPFAAFLDRRILKPLNLQYSRFATSSDLPLASSGYSAYALGPPQVTTPESEGWIGAAGALWASAPDLLRWNLALVEGKVLKPESYKIMTSPRVLSTGKISDYGCGLGVGHIDGEPYLRHTGGVTGFVSFNVCLPRTRSGMVLLSNTEHISTLELRNTIFNLLLKDIAAADAPAIPKISGDGPKETVLAFFKELQAGKIDRSKLGEEFNFYLNEERVQEAAKRMQALGEPTKVVVNSTGERGGMEVARVTLTFKDRELIGSMFRSTDGKIQQLLFYGE